MGELLDRERHELILRLLARSRYARVAELAGLLRSSETTVRRDLARLARAGLLRRVRGGATRDALPERGSAPPAAGGPRVTAGEDARVPPEGGPEGAPLPPFEIRRGIMLEKKRRIARRAAELCADQETVMIDGGSTTYQMVEFLEGARLQVITNSFAVAQYLVDRSRNSVILNGGLIDRDSRLVLDPFQETIFRHYYATRVFMGVYGIDELGATNTDPLLIQAERAMIEHSRELVVLADSSKLGRRGSLLLCGLERIHTLITDDGIRPEQRELVESRGVRLIVA